MSHEGTCPKCGGRILWHKDYTGEDDCVCADCGQWFSTEGEGVVWR
jgi:transcription initiation factor TFIIIB Brf1 subunit/transcription initiation factor TFIIB